MPLPARHPGFRNRGRSSDRRCLGHGDEAGQLRRSRSPGMSARRPAPQSRSVGGVEASCDEREEPTAALLCADAEGSERPCSLWRGRAVGRPDDRRKVSGISGRTAFRAGPEAVRGNRSPAGRCPGNKKPRLAAGVGFEALGDDLLLHGLSHTTIGAGAFHFRVRDGIGWDHTAMVAKELAETAPFGRSSHIGDLGRKQAFWACRPLCRRGEEASWSYMIKPHGSLVSVSSALLLYTPDLSTM